jgi:hypothetical protein
MFIFVAPMWLPALAPNDFTWILIEQVLVQSLFEF